MWGNAIGDSYGAGGLGLSGIGEGGGGRGEGIGLGSIGTIGHGSGTGSGDSSSALSIGDLAAVAVTDGVESGALFRYSLKAPVDLRPHGSALVPFLQQSISARRIVWFDDSGNAGRSAVRLKNDTTQTLPEGTIAFFADGGFAGESRLERLKPGESRTISFGAELDVELGGGTDVTSDETAIVTLDQEQLVEHYIRHHRIEYEITNRNAGKRTVFVGLNLVRNSSVKGADTLDFDVVASKPLAVFNVGAKEQVTRRLDADEGLRRNHPVSSLDSSRLRVMASSPRLDAKQRAALDEASRELLASETRQAVIPKRHEALSQILADLARLRDYLAAAKSDDESEKFTARILDKEDKIKALQAEIAKLRSEVDGYKIRARAALKKLER
jgi:hypothetical protein